MSLSRLTIISVVYLVFSLLDLFFIHKVKPSVHSLIHMLFVLIVLFLLLLLLLYYVDDSIFKFYYKDLFLILLLISLVSFPILFLIKLINKGFMQGLIIIAFLLIVSYVIFNILNIIACTIRQYNDFTNLGLFLSLATFTKIKIIPYSEEYYSEDTLSSYIYPNHVNLNNINEAKATISFISDFIELFLIIFSLVIINRQTIENIRYFFVPRTPFSYASIYISTYLLFSYVSLIYFIIYIIFYRTGCTVICHNDNRVIRHKSKLIDNSEKFFDKFKSKNHNC